MKYRIFLLESERGWGQERWHEDYDTYEEAKWRILEVNSKLRAGPAPDYYIQAEDRIEAVK